MTITVNIRVQHNNKIHKGKNTINNKHSTVLLYISCRVGLLFTQTIWSEITVV